MFEKINCPPAVAKTLSAQIKLGTVAGAYIFAGPDRDIKYKTALEFVRILNCKSPHSGIACGNCAGCLRPLPQTLFCSRKPGCGQDPPCHLCLTRDGKSNMDFLLMTSDKSLGIEPCRYLIHFMTRKSAPGVFKAAVIRESEILTPEAENSLLKILEEPPENCLVILITSSLHSLLPTIRSRSQILRFPPQKETCEGITESDLELARTLAQLRDSGSWKELFGELKKFHDVSVGKNKTPASARREKTHAFIESLLQKAATVMREKPSERLSFEIDYMHECCQMLKKQRIPNVVLSRMLVKGIPSFLGENKQC
ncbi:MAG: hypothetical protein Q7J59_05420 [Elusimicrobiota bacterium]|nr:hypothetical protein [Elusimicrobiota bacterium]